MQRKASLGVAIIARDAERTIGACLDSIVPYVQQTVVCVDELTTDGTAEVARKHGAEVHSIKVSDWHECEQHGRVLAQHFANARTESFSFLGKDLDWWMWLDSDDVVKGGERLADYLAQVPAEVIGVWLSYHYATLDEGRTTNTLFDRERILRASVGWEWKHRVHEVVVPRKPGPWLKTDTIAVYHQEGVHRSESSAERNLLLLQIDLEENPRDLRAMWYVGNQYVAMGRWREAVEAFERYTTSGDKNPYQVWQAHCYASMAYQQLGDLDNALAAAEAAIDVQPEHPEPYVHKARIYLQAGEFDKAVYWAKHALAQQDPPFFVFKNPMDRQFNVRVTLAEALAQLGHVTEARRELEAAYAVHADKKLGEAIERYRDVEQAASAATGFASLAQGRPDEEIIELWERLDLPLEVRAFGRCRDVAMPAYLRQRAGTRPRIIFWCGKGFEEWAPPSLNGTGIGGSETAVIEIAKRFAADGWRVDVYNSPGRYEGVYDEVGYWDPSRLSGGESADVLVSWRNPSPRGLPLDARVRLLWLHDLNTGPDEVGYHLCWDKALGVSQWHADMLRRYYGLPGEAVSYVRNGVNLERFDASIKKVPWRCVYASSPDRGLLRLLSLWPRIVENEPGAELHVAYGWETFDRAAVGRPDMQAFKARVMAAIERAPQVVYHGRLGQDELARLYSESYCWLYPTSFLEVSCISAMEAMAGGAVPVASDAGALKETVGKDGVLVPGQPHSRAWQDFYVNVARGILTDPAARRAMSAAGRERAKELTWDRAYSEHWKPLVEGLLAGKKEAAACA